MREIVMYRRPKFLEILLDIRQDMAHEADYDVDLFIETARTGRRPAAGNTKRPTTGPESRKAKTVKGRDPVTK